MPLLSEAALSAFLLHSAKAAASHSSCTRVLVAPLEVAQGLAGGSGRTTDRLQCFLNVQLYSLSDFYFDYKLSVIFNLFSGFHLTLYSATAGLFLTLHV